MTERFVCVFNRNRDNYEVAVALHEVGLLERLVTDYYLGDDPLLSATSGIRSLQKRKHPKLPASAVKSIRSSFFLQSLFQVLHLPMNYVFPITDTILGLAAGFLAKHTKSHLYVYSGYSPPRWMKRGTRKQILFQFHPHPTYVRNILAADLAKYPEVSWSYRDERDTGVGSVAARDSDWQNSDHIICASTMTKRSLIFAGCPESRISVIPYGFSSPLRNIPVTTRDCGGKCEFLFVGQGVQRKGLHHLIMAWKAAALKNAHLTLVCYKIDPGIRRMIDGDSITLLSKQSDMELQALYARSHIFVMPSLVEGFGLVFLEALAHGCFIIGTENTGLVDLHLDSDSATIIEAGNPVALKCALVDAHRRTERHELNWHHIADTASKRSWGHFRMEIAQNCLNLINNS